MSIITWNVDPGLTGAIAILHDLELVELVDLEDHADRGRLLPKSLKAAIEKVSGPPYLVTLEDASAREGQDAGGTLKTGRTFGHLEGLFIGMGFPVRVVLPGIWKPSLGVPAKDDQAARLQVVQMAQMFFPQGQFIGPQGGLWHDRAEAALLGVWTWKHALGRKLPEDFGHPSKATPTASRLIE